MRKAREQAIISFKSDYAAALAMQWRQSRIQFKGQIGKDKASKDYSISNYAGHRYIFQPVKNGFWKISRIGVFFAATGTIDIEIFNNVDEDPIETLTAVPTVANKLTWYTLPTPLYLPMYSEQASYLQYFVLYAKNGFNPKDNTIHCAPCTGYTLGFGCEVPAVQANTNDARMQFTKWCNITGVTGSSVDAIKEATTGFFDHAMGLVIDSQMSCENQSIPCNDTDFEHSDIAKVMAYAVWYRAGMYLCDAILSSSNINRFTMLDRERLYAKKNSYKREYGDRIAWLTNPEVEQVKNFLLQTGCLECVKRMAFRSNL
jgi:hypothetical protein